jgi:hypothetical protein
MVTKVVAGACLAAFAALAAVPEPSEADPQRSSAQVITLRVSVPLAIRVERGSASFSATLGGTRWRVAATCYGGHRVSSSSLTSRANHPRFALVFASEPARED